MVINIWLKSKKVNHSDNICDWNKHSSCSYNILQIHFWKVNLQNIDLLKGGKEKKTVPFNFTNIIGKFAIGQQFYLTINQ